MSMSWTSPGVVLGALGLALLFVAALLFRGIAILRRSPERYRWFEVFVGAFGLFIGGYLLLAVNHQGWPWRMWAFTVYSLGSGAWYLIEVYRRYFRAAGERRA